jgi:trigger factor
MNDTTKIIKVSECKREIEITIPTDEVQSEFDQIVKDFAGRAKVHGFRPGKVPKDIAKRMYYQDMKESLVNSLIPKALEKELDGQGLKLVGSPILDDLFFEEGKPLRFKVKFEVWPEFVLPEYKNAKVQKKKASVTKKEIDQSLIELQTKSAQYIPVEGRGVQDGDYVVTELKSKDKKMNKSLPTEKVVILAGHPENEKALNQNLAGLKTEEERNFTISYDSNHKNTKLAGKEIEYDIKAESIKERKIPEINDDFAKDLGEYANLEELKAKVKQELLASKKQMIKREMAEEIVKQISNNLSFELPESAVERETVSTLRQLLAVQPQQDLKEDDALKLREETKKKAEKNLKNHLILMKIADQEKLSVSEEDVTEELKAIAASNNVPLAKVIESINKEGRKEELKDNLLIRKTVDFLVEHAIID